MFRFWWTLQCEPSSDASKFFPMSSSSAWGLWVLWPWVVGSHRDTKQLHLAWPKRLEDWEWIPALQGSSGSCTALAAGGNRPPKRPQHIAHQQCRHDAITVSSFAPCFGPQLHSRRKENHSFVSHAGFSPPALKCRSAGEHSMYLITVQSGLS